MCIQSIRDTSNNPWWDEVKCRSIAEVRDVSKVKGKFASFVAIALEYYSPELSELLSAPSPELRSKPIFQLVCISVAQEAIYEYCHELVERSKEVEEVKGLDTIKYAFEVFCPEAITKAICKLAMVDMETAAEIFEKGWFHLNLSSPELSFFAQRVRRSRRSNESFLSRMIYSLLKVGWKIFPI